MGKRVDVKTYREYPFSEYDKIYVELGGNVFDGHTRGTVGICRCVFSALYSAENNEVVAKFGE